MKKIFIWIFSFLFLIGGSFAAGRYWKEHRNQGLSANDPIVNCGFRPAEFPMKNQSFVIFICGYNNGAFVEKTLHSVFSQVYDQYRLVYIDDASTDGGFEVAHDCINESTHAGKATFIRNASRLGLIANLIHVVQTCQDQEIIVVLNGEDWLAHEWVLSRLNQYYSDPDLWLTYGQYREFPSYRLGKARNYLTSELAQLRQAPFVLPHLKTFYAGLFKHIQEKDLLYQDALPPEGGDIAFMLPMIEMARDHFQFIPDILYITNPDASSVEDPEQQSRYERVIRSLKSYSPLSVLNHVEEPEQEEGT